LCSWGASATVMGLGFGADKLLEEAGYVPFFKKTMGNQLGKILTNLGYQGNNEYIELQKRMLEVKYRTRNVEELGKIINEMENDNSFLVIKDELQEFKNEFYKELQYEQHMRIIEQSKILFELKNIKKN
jgi:6-phosphofructokinase